MPSARYILRTRYILRIRYVPQAERVFYQKKSARRRNFSLFITYFYDLDDSDKNGGKKPIHKYFYDEIAEGEGNEDAEACTFYSYILGDLFCVGHKEYRAAEKEDACVDYGAEKRGDDRGKELELRFKKLVDESCDESAACALEKNGDNGAGNAEGEEESRAAGYENYDAEYESEPRADEWSADAGTDGDRDQSDGGRKGSEEGGVGREELKDNDECCHHRCCDKSSCAFAVFCVFHKFLLAVVRLYGTTLNKFI